jgi:hypothetical protein
MAGYLGTKAVLLSTTAANVVGNAEIGGDLTVGGTVTADGLTVDGEATFGTATGVFPDEAVLVRGNNGTSGYINGLGVGSSNAQFRIFADDTNITAGSIKFDIRNRDRLLIEDNGDISFYEDTGTTPKFFWDASAESLGIGTTSPSAKLHLSGTGATDAKIDLQSGTGIASVDGRYGNLILSSDEDNVVASSLMSFKVDNTERMRIDDSGNLLVGTTVTNLHTTATETGSRIADGFAMLSRSGGEPLYLNRLTSDGGILQFRKGGVEVGSIQSRAGVVSTIILDPRTAGAGLTGAGDGSSNRHIVGTNESGAEVDGGVNLGKSGVRFKDGYFSGTVNATAFVGDGSALTGIDATPPTTYGAVGTYGFFRHTSLGATISAGSTYAGSSLVAAGASTGLGNTATTVKTGTNGSAPSGTWRAMGHHTARSDSYVLTTFVRIS